LNQQKANLDFIRSNLIFGYL